MKKRNKIFIISVIVLILILSIGAWFVADKLNRIDYTDSSNNLAGENVSTEEPLLEDTVDSLEERWCRIDVKRSAGVPACGCESLCACEF